MSVMMKTVLHGVAAVVVCAGTFPFLFLRATAEQPPAAAWLAPFRGNVAKLQQAAQADSFAWTRLAELTDTYGNRISGSENLTRAIRWAQATMTKDGLANVRAEKVMVPRWVRGQESAVIVDPPEHPIAMLGLGGSVATPAAGIEADVLVVKDFKDLEARAAQAKGKIVLFNVPYTTYGETVAYRSGGATAAAKHGAVASFVRAVGPMGLRTPHTGGMNYGEGVAKIPTAAIAAEDANRIQRLSDRGLRVRVRLKDGRTLSRDARSFRYSASRNGPGSLRR